MQIIAVAIQKGGAGKTTTAAALVQAASLRGKKVLAIDLDPQGNLSFALGANMKLGNSYDLITGKWPANKLIQFANYGIEVIPASWNLSTITSGPGSARRLQDAIKPIKEWYDLIVVDTPPTAGELQYNALQACTGLVIPLEADIYNLQSFYQIVDTAQQIRKNNPALEVKGYVITNCNPRSTIVKMMQESIAAAADKENIPCLGTVRSSVAVKEAAATQRSLFDYARNSKPAIDYLAIYDALGV